MERRKSTRYRLYDYHYEIFDDNNNAIGWITDISDGGLSFEYIPTDVGLSENGVINIFSKEGEKSFQPGIACKKIYDIKIDDEDICHIPVEFRRCGVALQRLVDDQREQYERIVAEIKSIR